MTHTPDSASGPDEWPPDLQDIEDPDTLSADNGWPDAPDADGTTAAGRAAGTARWANGTWEPGEDDALVLAALVSRVLLQDAAALSAMYQLVSGAVYAQLLRLTHQVPLAEELLEDVFWQLLAPGVRCRLLRDSGGLRAELLQLQAGAWLSAGAHTQAQEVLVVQGGLHSGFGADADVLGPLSYLVRQADQPTGG
ncbi:MAG: hypothetical protein QE285_12910 [Aquabacterium sp.]|nr:hypothetical protein [Aquabacterium sp.]